MGTIAVSGTDVKLDENGYLVDFDDWSPDVASRLAEDDGVRMTGQHWEVVQFLREYYRQYQIAPMIKILLREMDKRFGPAKGSMKYLYTLFPEGPAKQACRIAGLPKPAGCV